MTFLDELREFLLTVERSGVAPATVESRVDMTVVRRHFLESLERAER